MYRDGIELYCYCRLAEGFPFNCIDCLQLAAILIKDVCSVERLSVTTVADEEIRSGLLIV